MAAIDQRNGSVESHSPQPPTPPPRDLVPVAAGAGAQPMCAPQTVTSEQRRQSQPQQPAQSQRQPVGSRRNTATTQLEFTQAMRDFKTMFPEMDDDVIEVILRANQGAVDATIDQLLAMSTDNENERLRTEMDATENAEAPPGYSPVTPPPTYQQAVPTCATAVTATAAAVVAVPPKKLPSGDASTSSIPLRVTKDWRPPLLGALPADFLRIGSLPDAHRRRRTSSRPAQEPCSEAGIVMASTGVTLLCTAEDIQQKIEENERRRRKLSATAGSGGVSDGCGADPDLARCLEDERIALFLQNEEFMSELRSNRDFLSTLELDDSDSDTERQSGTGKAKAIPDDAGGKKQTANDTESEDVFREKLSNMGKKSKHKFAQLARLFSRQKKRSGTKQTYPYARLSDGGVGSMPSRDHLLAEDISDEDDEDDDDDYPDTVAGGQSRNEYRPIRNSSGSGAT